MLITILTDLNSWINGRLSPLIDQLKVRGHQCSFIHSVSDLKKGDIAFILSFSKILTLESLILHQNNIVVHESDLPAGKGWSPLTWQILEGKNKIPICLFEACDGGVDSGQIYLRDIIQFNGTELVEELRDSQAEKTIEMCIRFIDGYPGNLKNAETQIGIESFYPKRTAKDSKLDIDRPLKDLFSLLRTVDNARYPAYFETNGTKYIIRIEKA